MGDSLSHLDDLLTSVIHYSLGVSFNYSLLVLAGYLLFIIPDFGNPNIHFSFFI